MSARRARPSAVALAVGLGFLVVAVGGCGDDPSATTDVSSTPSAETTEVTTAPTSTTSTSTTSTEPTTTSTSTTEPTTTTSTGDTSITTTEEDTEENDLPPKPGSPEEAFEEECEKHPDRCG